MSRKLQTYACTFAIPLFMGFPSGCHLMRLLYLHLITKKSSHHFDMSYYITIAKQVMNILDLANTSMLGALGYNMDTILRYFPAMERNYRRKLFNLVYVCHFFFVSQSENDSLIAGLIGSNDGRGCFVSFGNHFIKIVHICLAQLLETKLINHQQIR